MFDNLLESVRLQFCRDDFGSHLSNKAANHPSDKRTEKRNGDHTLPNHRSQKARAKRAENVNSDETSLFHFALLVDDFVAEDSVERVGVSSGGEHDADERNVGGYVVEGAIND